jgi:signal transduction histidine kinase
MYGYEKQEFISLSASSLGFIHEDKNEYDNLKNGIFDNVLQHAIFTNIKKDGTRFLTEFYSERCVYNNREARIALCFDITERKQIEKEKELLTNELIEKNNDLEEFAYVISHNLRSPVANILGLINVINLPQSSKEDIDFALRKLQVAGNTLDKIVRDMNEILSKRDDKTGQKIKSTIDVETEIKDILGSIENMIVSSKATIHCEFHLAPTIITFHPYFHNITINLITNALKYHNPERKSIISIKTYPQDNFICLNIKDNGLGMDMDLAQNKIFKLYNRFHLHIEGKGIGLYLVRNQIHAMGGKIEVKSKLNEGSEFTVYFPHVPSLSLN